MRVIINFDNGSDSFIVCFNNNNKSLIVSINYVLLDFYLCHFKWYNSIKRLNCA